MFRSKEVAFSKLHPAISRWVYLLPAPPDHQPKKVSASVYIHHLVLYRFPQRIVEQGSALLGRHEDRILDNLVPHVEQEPRLHLRGEEYLRVALFEVPLGRAFNFGPVRAEKVHRRPAVAVGFVQKVRGSVQVDLV